jgi:hypothetical protein
MLMGPREEEEEEENSAITHTAHESNDCVWAIIPRHIVSHFGDIAWPARSPDFSAPDYFLWEHLKSKCTWANLSHLIWKSTSGTKL